MNLVAKEFVAARDDERGVLVLSQFTGAARELTEALIVNPYDLDEASSALAAALEHAAGGAARPDARDARLRGRVQRLPLGRTNAGGCGAAPAIGSGSRAAWWDARSPEYPRDRGSPKEKNWLWMSAFIRFVSNYVLDLLTAGDIADVLSEARRVLTAEGRLCVVSLTHGSTLGITAYELGMGPRPPPAAAVGRRVSAAGTARLPS